MKLGFVSAILADYSFEAMIDTAASLGFSCVEVACWPKGKAERRYAGVSHIDVENLTEDKAQEILRYVEERNITISSLAYYPNPMDGNLEARETTIRHLRKVINASKMLGVNLVTTFIGRDQYMTVEENLDLLETLWPPILSHAEEKGVRIAIENCPMLFGPDQWPGGQNLFTTPSIWREVFRRLPSKALGINFDPSHFVWQQMDYLLPLKEFKDKIFHVHFKDIKLYPEKLQEVGVMAYPLEYMSPKLPGLGDVDWGAYVSTLNEIGFRGFACIEVEDRDFEDTPERVLDSLILSKRYLEQFVI